MRRRVKLARGAAALTDRLEHIRCEVAVETMRTAASSRTSRHFLAEHGLRERLRNVARHPSGGGCHDVVHACERTTVVAAVLAVAALALSAAHAQDDARADADAMQAKIARVAAAAETPRAPSAPPLRTELSEREINAYLALEGPAFLPAGIAMPRARLGDGGRVSARAVLDLDAVRRSRERSLFDPLAYLTGAVEVIAIGRVEAGGGEGVIRYESATVGGVAVPKTVAQELLRFYTRTPDRPRGFAFDEPFALPAGVRAVSVERGIVTVVQ